MAEYDPSEAFWPQQEQPNGNTQPMDSALHSNAEGNEEDEEDYDPSALMPDTSYSLDTSSELNASHPVQSDVPNTSAIQSSGAQSSAQRPPPQASPQPISQASNAQDKSKPAGPRTVGGFIVDDDSDDDVNPLGEGASLPGDGHNLPTAQRSVSQTPSNTVAPSHMSGKSPLQNQHVSSAPNGSLDKTNHSQPVSSSNLPDTASVNGPTTEAFQSLSVPSVQKASNSSTPVTSLPKARLPHDRVGILEDRIAEDPRGDLDAWLNLIGEHKKRLNFEAARATYEKFFALFPTAEEQWVAYAKMELSNGEIPRLERIFQRVLLELPSVELWALYLNHIRRIHDLNSDPNGQKRKIVSEAFSFALDKIGKDKDSGKLWQEYLEFLKSGPGTIGGSGWQDQQKMDNVRKAYRLAICIPTQAITTLWKEYDSFEMSLNKNTGRKFLQEKSPAYVTARSANIALQNITKDLDKSSLAKLPPAQGFEGDVEYARQVEVWKKWIDWEKDDPLVLKDEDLAAWKARVLYVYRRALIPLRFWPETWFEAAEFCFQNGLDAEGEEFLNQGVAANRESCLLGFKRADRTESAMTTEKGENDVKRRGDAVRETYDKLLDSLYGLISEIKKREERTIARLKETFGDQSRISPVKQDGDNEDQPERAYGDTKEAQQKAQIEMIQNGHQAEIKNVSRILSFAWIALMRAMRRIQGKGKVGDAIGGSRQVFSDARKRGRITSDVYVASALMEQHCYQDPAGTKIFERGMKLFPDNEEFALEYIKHLIGIHDVTNARAVFETTVSKLSQKPETKHKAKPLYAFFHEFESQFGELGQIKKLEKRIPDLFPEDATLSRFRHRFEVNGFDPTSARPIISPAAQARPKALPSIEKPASVPNTPRAAVTRMSNSPKRHFPGDDSDVEPARKLLRGESPLRGAAGRRQVAQKRNQQRLDGISDSAPWHAPAPVTLPAEVMMLLSVLPSRKQYNGFVFDPKRVLDVIRQIDLSRANIQPQQHFAPPMPVGQSLQPPPPLQQGLGGFQYRYGPYGQ